MGGMALFGSELGAMKAEEKPMMIKAWADYCESMGVVDVPPGLALIIAMSMYSLPRALSEQGKARLLDLFGKAKSIVVPKREPI